MELTQQGNIIRRRFQLYLGILTRQAMKEQNKCRSRQSITQSSRARYNVILGPPDLVAFVQTKGSGCMGCLDGSSTQEIRARDVGHNSLRGFSPKSQLKLKNPRLVPFRVDLELEYSN